MAYNEASLKKKIHTDLAKVDKLWKFSPCQHGHGANGIPDIICIQPVLITPEHVGKTLGLFVGIEAKIKPNKQTKLQQSQLEGIAAAGGRALVISGRKGEKYTTEEIKVK